jgi:hypothetical protein
VISPEHLEKAIADLSPRELMGLRRVMQEMGETGSSDPYYRMLSQVYEEMPVDMGEFLYSPQFLDLKTVIFPRVADILVACDDTKIREFYLELGKGSGKSLICSVLMTRMVYRMLCLRSPHRYLELDPVDSIAVVNMSVQGGQAEHVVFKAFRERVKRSPWFNPGKARYKLRGRVCEFDKDILAFAGNSSDRAFLGYHTICGIMDEVNFFKNKSTGESTAEDVVTALRGSMHTRAPHDYKLGLISSVRAETDYLSSMIDAVKERGYPVEWETLGKEGVSVAMVRGN